MKQSHKINALLAAVLVLIMMLLFANQGMLRQNLQAERTPTPTLNFAEMTSNWATAISHPTASLHDLRITATYMASLPKFPTIANPPTMQITPASPTATSTLQPPTCTFPLSNIKYPESKPEEYTFSEPQVVLTDKFGIDIIEWLPDSQRVLVTQLISVTGNDAGNENIELFNPETGEIQVYATRRSNMWQPPAWVESLNSVIYSNTELLNYPPLTKTNPPSYEIQRQLGLSQGNPENIQIVENAQMVVSRLPFFSLAIKPDGSEIIYRYDFEKQLTQYDTSSGMLVKDQSVPFDTTKWEYEENFSHPIYNMVWRPNTTQLFLSSDGLGSVHGSYSFLFDINTGKVCEIDFGRELGQKKWAGVARWSPNGRYLAIVRAKGFQVDFTDLAVLDTATGNLYTMEFYPQDMVGRRYVMDIAWASDNYHLAAISEVTSFPGCAPNCNSYRRLYVVDFINSQTKQLFPSYQFAGGSWGTNLAWSLDGSKIIANCPTENEGRLCLISVQKTVK